VPAALLVAAGGPVAWTVAPQPPASWQRDRTADLAARRRAAMERIGTHGMLLLYAAEPRNYAGDVDWPYRQENNFFYLTGVSQEGATLALLPGAAEGMREILFLPRPNPQREPWTGHMLTAAEGREISGIREVWDASLLQAFLTTLMPRGRAAFAAERQAATAPSVPAVEWREAFQEPIAAATRGDAQLFMLLPQRPDPEYRREREFASRLGGTGAGIAIRDAVAILESLRRIKSAREIDILQHAVDITAEAFQRVYTLAVAGAWEYEVQAQFELTYLRRGGHWGYPPIVGAGRNATTLHYETNRDRIAPGDLLLLDDAAEFDGYSADVTRTIPVSGRFTPEQAAIYRLVWDAHQASIAAARPGHAISAGAESMYAASARVFKEGLFRLGLITDTASDRELRIWFNHGIGHGIGLNVHDAGNPELQPGMVVTVEPGLYFRPDALDHLADTPENQKFIAAVRPAFEKYKGIGVRIEDDLLITTGDAKVLSAAIPAKLEDVEAAIARWRNAAKTVPLP
jgi:Xaa-Pro aminopeptidase